MFSLSAGQTVMEPLKSPVIWQQCVGGWRHATLWGQQDKQTHRDRVVGGEHQHKSQPTAVTGDWYNLKHVCFLMRLFFEHIKMLVEKQKIPLTGSSHI